MIYKTIHRVSALLLLFSSNLTLANEAFDLAHAFSGTYGLGSCSDGQPFLPISVEVSEQEEDGRLGAGILISHNGLFSTSFFVTRPGENIEKFQDQDEWGCTRYKIKVNLAEDSLEMMYETQYYHFCLFPKMDSAYQKSMSFRRLNDGFVAYSEASDSAIGGKFQATCQLERL